MRTSALLLLVGLAAGSAYGQDTFPGQNAPQTSPAPVPPRFEFKDLPQYRGSRDGRSWIFVPNPFSKSKLPGVNPVWLNGLKKLELRPSVCAVPLLEAPIPKEMRFSMPVLKGEEIDSMPEAQLPAPSCGDKGR